MLISIEQTCFRTSLLRANKDLFKRSISLSSVDSREGVIRVGLLRYPLLLEPEALLSSESL